LFSPSAFSSKACGRRVARMWGAAVGGRCSFRRGGFFLWAGPAPAEPWLWAALTASLFLTYQVRPIYQFLVVLFPVIGWVLLGMIAGRDPWRRLRWRVFLGLAAVGLLPFLGWCTLRLYVVGHLGLVSFTGNTMGGIAGQILDETVVPELPEWHQDFARRLLERRDKILAGQLRADFGPWEPAFDENGMLIPGSTDNDDVYLFAQ